MADILLVALNARYAHAAFGLRYLLANLGPLRPRAELLEFDINQRSVDILEAILRQRPRVVGLGVYIWNVELATRLAAELKRVAPEVAIVLGGPEVSYETQEQPIAHTADFVITGEGDLAFANLCQRVLDGRPPLQKVIAADLPELSTGDVALPYELYDQRDLTQRVVYVEASRGCPFRCEFCLSSLDVPVRQFPLVDFLAAMERLLARGLRQFKFVDRTFNLNLQTGRAILEFFLARYEPGLFLHFEMIPDRLPDALREPITRFPAGALQFEVGIQTFNPQVAQLISRKQDYAKVRDNLTFLRQQTGVHIHADLIVGLPGEDVESFGRGFDELVALGPQEIQVGMLKRLRGTPIVRHDSAWEMVYSPQPAYEILQTKLIDFASMARLRRFARYWDLLANSGNFLLCTPRLWRPGPGAEQVTPFVGFLRFADWLYAQVGQSSGIALTRLTALLHEYLTGVLAQDEADVNRDLLADYQRGGRSDIPACLREATSSPAPARVRQGQRRQQRHRESD